MRCLARNIEVVEDFGDGRQANLHVASDLLCRIGMCRHTFVHRLLADVHCGVKDPAILALSQRVRSQL